MYIYGGETGAYENGQGNFDDVLKYYGIGTNYNSEDEASKKEQENQQDGPKPKKKKEEKPLYGNFTGPGPDISPLNLTNTKGDIIRPINELDQQAQYHDLNYWINGASGVKGAFFDISVAEADLKLSNAAFKILGAALAGKKDKITNKLIIKDFKETRWSLGVALLFQGIATYKIPMDHAIKSYNGFINNLNTAWLSTK